MIIDRRETPRGEIALRRLNGGFEIIYNGVILMSYVNGESEARLASETLSRVIARAWRNAPAPPGLEPGGLRVLVGGVGMGYTLRAVLDYPGTSDVIAAEIEPVVIEWNRRYFRELNRDALDDPRCEVVPGDVLEVARNRGRGRGFDAVLIDTDNGPDSLVSDENQAIYSAAGIRVFREVLRQGGCLGVWSAAASEGLFDRMRRVFPEVETVKVPCPYAPQPDYIYIARKTRRTGKNPAGRSRGNRLR